MKSYFIHDGQQQLGPYTISELSEKNIKSDTPIWTEELDDWTAAGELPEFNSLLKKVPPPLKQQKDAAATKSTRKESASEGTGFRVGRFLGLTGLIISIILITGFIVYNSSQSSANKINDLLGREKSPYELRLDLEQRERMNPTEYLVDKTTMRWNLRGEAIIEGSVMNNASVASFKDIVLEVSYLSKTGSIISTEHFTIYEVAGPGKWASFKFKTYSPKDTKGFSAVVINAVPL
jgi:hypothetical protein